jgi:hypothetical protein
MANFAIFTARESYQTAVSDGDIGFDRVGRRVKRLGKKAVASGEKRVRKCSSSHTESEASPFRASDACDGC